MSIPAFFPYLAGCGIQQRRPDAEMPVSESEEFRQQQLARRAEALRRLSSADRQVRERAAIELLSMGDEGSLNAITEKLAGPTDPEIKVDILNAISFRADRRCFDSVLRALSDPHVRVREAAAAALANFSKPDEIRAIIEYAESPELSNRDRERIYMTMGDGIFVSATPVLIEGLKSENAEVREAAWQSLRRIWDRNLSPSPQPWIELWEINRLRSREEILEERLRAAEADLGAVRQRIRDLERELNEFSEIAMSDRRRSPRALTESLAADNPRIMEYAAYTLSNLSREDLKDLDLDDRDIYINLRNAVREGSPRVAAYIAGLIEKLEGAYRDELILDAFQHPSADAVAAAIAAVREQPVEAVVNGLEELLRHPSAKVRETAANALSRSTAESTVAALRSALKDEEANVRWFAVESLRKLNATRAVPDLAELLEGDPSPLVREIAATTLGQMLQPAAFPSLRRALQDESRRVREQAARALTALAVNNPERILSVGEALIGDGFLTEAKRLMENASENPEYSDSAEVIGQIRSLRIKLADGFREQENYSEAAGLYAGLLQSPDHMSEARRKLILCYIAAGDYARLLDDYRQWLQTDNIPLRVELLEEGVAVLENLHGSGVREETSMLADILESSAGSIDPLPEELLERIRSFKEPAESDAGPEEESSVPEG